MIKRDQDHRYYHDGQYDNLEARQFSFFFFSLHFAFAARWWIFHLSLWWSQLEWGCVKAFGGLDSCGIKKFQKAEIRCHILSSLLLKTIQHGKTRFPTGVAERFLPTVSVTPKKIKKLLFYNAILPVKTHFDKNLFYICKRLCEKSVSYNAKL